MSVDFAAQVNLTLTDINPDVLVAQAVTDAVTKWPLWIPREGNTEMVLLELLAVEIAEAAYALNRLPALVLEGLMSLYGVTKSAGTKAGCNVTFTASDTLGHTLPIGTRVRVADRDAVTTSVLTIPAASSTGTAAVEMVTATAAANLIPTGTVVVAVDPVSWLQSAVTASVTAGGTEPETDATYLVRAAQVLQRVSTSLVTAAQFTAHALGTSGIGRATTIDLYNPVASFSGPGSDLGYVAVAVTDPNGNVLTAPVKAALQADMQARCHAGLQVTVMDGAKQTIPVTVTVKRFLTHTAAQVQANVTAALQAFLNPAVWTWGRAVQPSDLYAVIDSAAGVDYVQTLTAPAGPIFLQPWMLAAAGAITVTVI